MLAVVAVIAFAIGLILHLVGGGAAKYVLDFELAGLIFVALHLAFGGRVYGWAGPRTPPA